MKLRTVTPIAGALLALVSLAAARADDPKTHTVTAEPFKVEIKLQGVVEAAEMAPIEADMQSWSDLVIESVVPEGTAVAEGDALISFKTDKIDRRIKESEYALHLAKLGLKESELAVRQFEATYEMDQKLAQRAIRVAEEDFNFYMETERPLREKNIKNSMINSEFYRDNAREELDQLQKMYDEDELVEESEEIVLRRAQRAVENAELNYEAAAISNDRELNTEMPRELEQREDALARARLEYEKQQASMPMTRERKAIELEKAYYTLEIQTREHDELLADRAMMTLHAPREGIVYYGQCERGQWKSASGSGPRTLELNDDAPANRVLMTIVDTTNLFVRADVDEANLASLRPGMVGWATPASLPDVRIPAQIKVVSPIPVQSGKFNCEITLNKPADVTLMPGMNCEVKVVTYEAESALTVPSSAIFTDDDQEFYVYLKTDAGHERRVVTKGKVSGDKTEIVDGLSAGQQVLLEKPTATPSAADEGQSK